MRKILIKNYLQFIHKIKMQWKIENLTKGTNLSVCLFIYLFIYLLISYFVFY